MSQLAIRVATNPYAQTLASGALNQFGGMYQYQSFERDLYKKQADLIRHGAVGKDTPLRGGRKLRRLVAGERFALPKFEAKAHAKKAGIAIAIGKAYEQIVKEMREGR